MNETLQEALTGAPVTVTLGGQQYTLAFPMEAVILYKRETAFLDQARNFGKARLTRAETRELREQRRKLLTEADGLRPAENENWTDDNFARFEDLFTEALLLKTALDQDAGTGDSLYDKQNWWKISPEKDPERLRLAVWVGLHQFEDSGNRHSGLVGKAGETALTYRPQISRETLGTLIDLGNGEALTTAVSKALRAHLIVAETEPLPNAPAPATLPAEAKADTETILKQSRRATRNPQPPEGTPDRRHPNLPAIALAGTSRK